MIKRIRKFIPRRFYSQLYYSLFQSYLVFGISAWGGACSSKLVKVFALQKRVVGKLSDAPLVHLSCPSRAPLVPLLCPSRAPLVHLSCPSRAPLVHLWRQCPRVPTVSQPCPNRVKMKNTVSPLVPTNAPLLPLSCPSRAPLVPLSCTSRAPLVPLSCTSCAPLVPLYPCPNRVLSVSK